MDYIGQSTPEFLNGFTLVKSDIEQPSVKLSYYFCLGRHDFYLVPFPSSPSPTATADESSKLEKPVLVFSYRDVVEILKHEDEPDLMTIVMGPGTVKRYKNAGATNSTPRNAPEKPTKPILQPVASFNVYCGERQNLLTEFVVCLKASHMFFTFEIHTEDVVRSIKKEKSNFVGLLSLNQPSPQAKEQEVVDKMWRTNLGREKTERHLILGYSFYIAADFKERPLTGMNKRLFYKQAKRDTDSLELGLVKLREGVEDALLYVEQVDPTGEKLMPIQSLAERKMREICSYVIDYRLRSRPTVYMKRMNLRGDPASWTCWMIRLRTLRGKTSLSSNANGNGNGNVNDMDNRQYELRNVTIIACRRNFIPPTMQSHCDFLITHISQYEDFNASSEVDCDEITQLVCDTLSPNTASYDRDELVIQATADALLLDDPSYFWYESELRVRPRAQVKAREFCRALFDLLLTTSLWNDTQKQVYSQLVHDTDQQLQVSASSSSSSSSSPAAMNGQARHQQRSSSTLPKPQSSRATATSLGSTSSSKQNASAGQPLNQVVDESPDLRLFRIADELEMMVPGLDEETDGTDKYKGDWVAWRIRVWRYLAYCADGAIYKEAVNLEQLCKAWKSSTTDKEVRYVLGRILDKFIHLRQIGDEYRQDELYQKASSERLMSACTFNERVITKLLRKDTGYIQAALSAYEPHLYPKFLVRLLCRNDEIPGFVSPSTWLADSMGGAIPDASDPCEPIAHAVLKCLVVQSSAGPRSISSGASTPAGGASSSRPSSSPTPSNRPSASTAPDGDGTNPNQTNEDRAYDVSLNILVPALIRVFMNHPEDDRLRTFVVAILVNYSRNNYSVKANILAGGFGREIVKLLKSKDDDLVRHACSLLTNLTKTPDFRATIYRGPAKASLLDLITKNVSTASVASLPDADKYRAPKIVSQACQVIGNLAIDGSIRLDLLRGEEIQHDADGNYAIPIVVRALADLVFKEDYLATFSMTSNTSSGREKQELEDVRASALFALKNLSISPSQGTTSSVGQGDGVKSSSQGSGNGISQSTSVEFVPRNVSRINVKAALGRYASKPFLKLLRDREVRDRNLIDYLLRLLYSLCYEPKVALKLHSERIADGLALRKQDFANLCLQIQTKIANQQKSSSGSLSGGGGGGNDEENETTVFGGGIGGGAGGGNGQGTDIFTAFQPPSVSALTNDSGNSGAPAITGGILRQSRFASKQQQPLQQE